MNKNSLGGVSKEEEEQSLQRQWLSRYFPVKLRPYQIKAVCGLTKHLFIPGAPPLSGIVHLRTGAGKTNIAAAVAFIEIFHHYLQQGTKHKLQNAPKDIVVLTPSCALTRQQAQVFVKIFEYDKINQLAATYGLAIVITMEAEGKRKILSHSPGDDGRTKLRIRFFTPATFLNTSTTDLSTLSTLFFDEVHHCAASHPYALVAEQVQSAIKRGMPLRMVGLTATLCYSQTEEKIKCDIRALFTMLNAPLAERYSASEEELARCGVPKPPECKVLDLFASKTQKRPPEWISADPALVLPLIEQAFPTMSTNSKTQKDDLIMVDRNVHRYTKRIYILMRYLEKELMNGMEKGSLLLSTKLKDITSQAIRCLDLDSSKFLTSARPQSDPNDNLTDDQLQGELLCVLYQAMRLIIASKQRELELAVRFIHRSRRVFKALGWHTYIDNYLPLQDDDGNEVFDDCIRVAKALEALTETHSKDFRAVVFCEQGLSVAMMAEYITSYFSHLDEDTQNPYRRRGEWKGEEYAFRAEWLCSTGNTPAYNIPHLSKTELAGVLDAFRDGSFNVMCSTTVAEEGLDISALRYVIHVAPPSNPVAHTQRSGRARHEDSHAVVLSSNDGSNLETLRKATTLQSLIADQLSRSEGANEIPITVTHAPAATRLPPSLDSLCFSLCTAVTQDLDSEGEFGAPMTLFVPGKRVMPPGLKLVNPPATRKRQRYVNPISEVYERAQHRPGGKVSYSQSGSDTQWVCTMTMEYDSHDGGRQFTASSEVCHNTKLAKNAAAEKLLDVLDEAASY